MNCQLAGRSSSTTAGDFDFLKQPKPSSMLGYFASDIWQFALDVGPSQDSRKRPWLGWFMPKHVLPVIAYRFLYLPEFVWPPVLI